MSMLPPPSPIVAVHEPVPDDRDRKTRKPLFFFDRIKVSLILVAYFTFVVVLKHADVPIMSWEEAVRDELRAKWWVVALLGVEIARQIHYLIAERSARYTASGTTETRGSATG
jgi:cell division protease FtsH